jgi:multiple sugar transport system substrate-binding protein
MEEIVLSVMSYTADRVTHLQNLLAEFEAQHHVRVVIRTLTWESSWSEILKFVFQGHGPAVSEVGNTWITSLAKMNSLRPFEAVEVAKMGGEAAFIPATWHREPFAENVVSSIPWLAESRVILYRRDILKAAGVDEATAFENHKRLVETLERLQKVTKISPWLVPTAKTLNTLHTLPNWIRGEGGHFVDEKRNRVTFADPQAKVGVREYYSLYRFIKPELWGLDPYEAQVKFEQGQAAVTISGPWLVFPVDDAAAPAVRENIGVAKLPGTPTVLASNLVVWKHTPVRQEALAVELVKYLTSKKVQVTCSQETGLVPARLDTLALKPFSNNAAYQIFVDTLKSGRPLPMMRLWGLIEERLTAAFGNIWQKVLASPNPDLDAIIEAELNPLAQKLNQILQ